MKCSACNEEMILKREMETNNPDNNRKYEKKTYWCKKDDVWISVETPKN